VAARAARAERVTQLAFAAGGAALAAAGLDETGGAPRPRIGIVLGTAFGCFLTNAAYQQGLAARGPAAASPRLFAATVSNAAAGEIGIAYRLGGPSVVVSAGAASGLVALGHACDLLAAGRAEAFLTGGVDAVGDALDSWMAAGGYDPGRPVAEGAALLVLETAAAAAARGARVLGTIEGWAGGFEPEPAGPRAGEALAAAIELAVAAAGLKPAAVAILARGAPPALAGAETRAVVGALGRLPASVLEPKDGRGETLGAAGPLALLAALAEAQPGAALLVLDLCASGHAAALVARRGTP
jgi:3-oxoacyl-[acyl-carrier-protein] synthase II